IPTWQDLEVFLQLLPRSSTGERMNPYTTLWTGVYHGDGPQEFHLVLLDNGRTQVLADIVGRQALDCIRCSACLNICPVYARVDPENVAMRLMARTFASRERYEQAQRLAQLGQLPFIHHGVISALPGPLAGWTTLRDLQPIPRQTFREWWRSREDQPQTSEE